MSIESKSLSSPVGNRERLNTQTRSKPRAELRYPCPGAARSGQREGGLLGGCRNRRALLPPCVARPLVKRIMRNKTLSGQSREMA